MKVYDRIETYFAKHAYVRGHYKGDAPANPARREDTDKRIIRSGTDLCLRVYSTTIARVSPDDTLTLTTNDWHTLTTFRSMREFFARFRIPLHVSTKTHRGLSQIMLRSGNTTWAFYEGMKLQLRPHDPPINLAPKPFKYLAIDRVASAEFRRNSKSFFNMLPLLHASLPEDGSSTHRLKYPGMGAHLREAIANPTRWPEIVEWYALATGYGTPRSLEKVTQLIKRDAAYGLHGLHDTPYTHL